MAEVNPMLAVGDTMTVRLPRDKSQSVSMAIVNMGAASFSAVPEVSWDDGVSYAALTLTKSDATTTVALAAAGSTAGGWARVPGATHVRLRLTAITTPTTGIVGRINAADGV